MTKITISRAVVERALEALERTVDCGHDAHECANVRAITALRSALAEPVQEPSKRKLVPTEPTVGMCIAGDEARQNVDDLTRTPAIYRAMIAAAPALPQQAEPVQEPVKQCMAHGECFGGECIYQRPAEPVQDERTTIADLRCAKWLDPECADKGACQSLKFKRSAEPVQAPLVWMSKADIENPSGWRTVFLHTSAMPTKDSVPLYTFPIQSKPLTEEEIDAEWHELDGEASALFKRVIRKFARAVERSHGIGE